MTHISPVETVEEFYRALAARDAAAITGVVELRFAEDASIVFPESLPYGGVVRGRATLRRMLAGLAAQSTPVGPAAIEVKDIIGGTNQVAAHVRFDWYPPGGTIPVPSSALELWTFADGLVREMRAFYWDTASLVPEPTSAAS